MSHQDHSTNALSLLNDYLHALADSGAQEVLLTSEAISKLQDIANGKSNGDQSHQDKVLSLNALREKAEKSEEYRSIQTLRDTMVFATGNPDAQIMFIGEAPGAEEEKQKEPFVGPAGKLLTKVITAMGLSRDDVYISNIVKFRPRIDGPDQGAKNRKPDNNEIKASIHFINAEIKIVNPDLIIALGASAMSGLLGLESSVNSSRGRLHAIGKHQAIVTYHPSFLLRSGSNADKRKLWEDMLMAMDYLQMPISEKQKNYFLVR
ncbi:MAG: uracil-DNA glycosylase [Verrucomicrobiaceae bacterium]|nr:uracil-DNA glycosylase [Verrucomicrobiaceae bacterium]